MPQVVAYKRLKTMENYKTVKSGKFLVFGIGGRSYEEVVTYETWSQMEVRLHIKDIIKFTSSFIQELN